MKSSLISYEPTGREDCLCGSGKRFKNCCKKSYKKKKFNGTELFNQEKYQEALLATRAHITWYRLCYKSHTEPFLNKNIPAIDELLSIDIKALSSLLDLLLACYEKCQILDDYESTFSYFESAINESVEKLKRR